MPLWKVFHGSQTLANATDKEAIAKAATEYYVRGGLPSFYVNVIFIPIADNIFFTGGQSKSTSVMIEIDHIARHMEPSEKARHTRFKEAVDAIMKPYTTDRGCHLEYTVLEGLTYLWRINGVDPPEGFGPDDHEQAEKNRAFLEREHGS